MDGKNKKERCTTKKTRRIFVFLVVLVTGIILYLGLNMELSGILGLGKSRDSSTSFVPESRSSSSSSSSSSLSSRHRKHHQLLLVTKGRSGSSYISAIINDHPSVFYTFEPLGFLDQVENIDSDVSRDRISGVLKFYLMCDLENINALDMNSTFHVSTNHGKKFVKCERQLNEGFAHIQCLLEYLRSCRKHGLTFSKVIRLPMRYAGDLLQMMPDLKIIYLIRDPRAVLYSQRKHMKKTFQFAWGNKIKEHAESHCGEIIDDLENIRRLKTSFPGRVQIARYENWAADTEGYSKKIYDFIGLEFTQKTQDFISYLQNPEPSDDNRAFGLRRSNTTEVMNRWRLIKGSYEAAQLIDNFCGEMYPELGYRKVMSYEHLVSIQKPLHRKGFRIT